MRQSRYTVEETLGNGEHLLYNTANGAFATLDDETFSCYESCDGPAIADLTRFGFVTDKTPEEELAALRAQLIEHRNDRSTLGLSLVPTYACNFRCPYCYEQDRIKLGGKMDEQVREAIVAFVKEKHRQDAFSTLSVQWYGGDPSLVLDVVEDLSNRLISWCDANGVAYEAMMLTNANAIGPDEADLIARCRVGMVLLTIDGPEEIHNQRRVATNGTNSYQKTLEAARLLRAHDIELNASMNVDRISWPFYAETRNKLYAEEGIWVNAGRLCDYGHTFGTPPFAAPQFDLFTHEEFCQERLRLFESEPHTAGELQSMLKPIRQFCTGQSGNYYVIDYKGDVFGCDGFIGYEDHVRFNITDDPDTWKPAGVVFDASTDEKCEQCELLPLCLGSCFWERSLTGMPCHPLKETMGSYLAIYRSCFEEAQPGFTLLAEPVENQGV